MLIKSSSLGERLRCLWFYNSQVISRYSQVCRSVTQTHLQLTNEEMEAQRGKRICPGSHRELGMPELASYSLLCPYPQICSDHLTKIKNKKGKAWQYTGRKGCEDVHRSRLRQWGKKGSNLTSTKRESLT